MLKSENLTLVYLRAILNRPWSRLFSIDLGQGIFGLGIFRPTSTRTIFRLTSISAFSVNVGQGCFWSILSRVIFWLRLARVFNQCRSVIFFGRHRLGGFRSTSTMTIVWATLVKVFVPDISRNYFLLMFIETIFWSTSNKTIFLLTSVEKHH